MAEQADFRSIPQVDALLRAPELAQSGLSCALLTRAAREEINTLRALIASGKQATTDEAVLVMRVLMRAQQLLQLGLRRAINATGITLHTNLGRAPLCADALRAIETVAGGYSTLEYDLESGMRGDRGKHVEALLCELTGAEAALVVNNNAAAILLALASLVVDGQREVIASRGELVEIGSSFRIPDVISESGATLVEVGMTNKTHLCDYETAISTHTAALLKVHTSNYRIVGFTGEVSVRELVALGARVGVPVVYDIGSGALLPAAAYPFCNEPTVGQALADGADIVTFSGDKLLGGPQAGIVVGKAMYIEAMRRRPLARALRPCKLTFAAMEATLRLYREPKRAKQELPALHMLCMELTELTQRAELLAAKLDAAGVNCRVVQRNRPVGGGSVPEQMLASAAVVVTPRDSAAALERRLRAGETPVIVCIAEGCVLLDTASVADDELQLLVREVTRAW